MKNKEQAKQLDQMARLMEQIEEVFGSRIEAHQVRLYCLTAAAAMRGEPADSRELAKEMGLSKSAVSRNIQWFTERGNRSREGLRMVRYREDAHDWRRKALELTPKGERAAITLTKAFGG